MSLLDPPTPHPAAFQNSDQTNVHQQKFWRIDPCDLLQTNPGCRDAMHACALHLDKQHCIIAAQNQINFTRCAVEPMLQNAPSIAFIMPRDLKFSGLPRVIRKFTRRRFCQSPRLFDKFCALVVLLLPKSCQPHPLRTFCPTRFLSDHLCHLG